VASFKYVCMYVCMYVCKTLSYNNCFALCWLEDSNPQQFKRNVNQVQEYLKVGDTTAIFRLALELGFDVATLEKQKKEKKVLPGFSSFPSFPHLPHSYQ